jgi:hypothetical protein
MTTVEVLRRKPPVEQRPSRAARMLALAHHVEGLIEAGELKDYAAAARTLGLTRSRLTQVMNLLLLAPKIQERILLDGAGTTERVFRRAGAESEWAVQAAAVGGVGPRCEEDLPS